jgi:hypothetical protein
MGWAAHVLAMGFAGHMVSWPLSGQSWDGNMLGWEAMCRPEHGLATG